MKSTREFKPPRPLVLIEEVVVEATTLEPATMQPMIHQLETILVGLVQHHSDLDLKTNALLKRDLFCTNASYA
jgi:hypothetical protein